MKRVSSFFVAVVIVLLFFFFSTSSVTEASHNSSGQCLGFYGKVTGENWTTGTIGVGCQGDNGQTCTGAYQSLAANDTFDFGTCSCPPWADGCLRVEGVPPGCTISPSLGQNGVVANSCGVNAQVKEVNLHVVCPTPTPTTPSQVTGVPPASPRPSNTPSPTRTPTPSGTPTPSTTPGPTCRDLNQTCNVNVGNCCVGLVCDTGTCKNPTPTATPGSPTSTPTPTPTLPVGPTNTPTPTLPGGPTATPQPTPTNTPRPTATPTPTAPFAKNKCKCDGMQATTLVAGKPVTFTAFSKIEGADVSLARQKEIIFKFYEVGANGTDLNLLLGPTAKAAAKLPGSTSTLVRYKADWSTTLPSNMKKNTLYLAYADVSNGCEPNAGVRGASTQAQKPGFFGRIFGFLGTLLGGEPTPIPTSTPTPTSAQTEFRTQSTESRQNLQLEPFYPGEIVVKECNYIYFKFNQL